jgi:F-type H+-transporting ATPase subunit delta
MNEGKISVRYAQALYAMAEEQHLEQEVYARMKQLAEAFLALPELNRTLSNPMHSATEKQELLRVASGVAPEALMDRFFRFVLDKNREEYMVFMAMSFQQIYRKKQRVVVGKITAAQPLKTDSVERIHQLVNNQFQASIELSTEVEPELIGGFILEVDHYRMDSSTRSELERLRHELLRD